MKSHWNNAITIVLASLSIFSSSDLSLAQKASPNQFDKNLSSITTQNKRKIFKRLKSTIGGVTGATIFALTVGGGIYLLKNQSKKSNPTAQELRDVSKIFYYYYIFKTSSVVATNKGIDCSAFVGKCDKIVGENSKLETLLDAYQCRKKLLQNIMYQSGKNSLLSDLENLIPTGTKLIDVVVNCRPEELLNGAVRVVKCDDADGTREYELYIQRDTLNGSILYMYGRNFLLYNNVPINMFRAYDIGILNSELETESRKKLGANPISTVYQEGVISRAWDLFIESKPEIQNDKINTAFVMVDKCQYDYMHPSGRNIPLIESELIENNGFMRMSNEKTRWENENGIFVLMYRYMWEEKLKQAQKELGYEVPSET